MSKHNIDLAETGGKIACVVDTLWTKGHLHEYCDPFIHRGRTLEVFDNTSVDVNDLGTDFVHMYLHTLAIDQ